MGGEVDDDVNLFSEILKTIIQDIKKIVPATVKSLGNHNSYGKQFLQIYKIHKIMIYEPQNINLT